MHTQQPTYRNPDFMLDDHGVQPAEELWPQPGTWTHSGSSWPGWARCAACGATQRVSADSRCGGVPFCHDCMAWSRDLTDWDDLGCGD